MKTTLEDIVPELVVSATNNEEDYSGQVATTVCIIIDINFLLKSLYI